MHYLPIRGNHRSDCLTRGQPADKDATRVPPFLFYFFAMLSLKACDGSRLRGIDAIHGSRCFQFGEWLTVILPTASDHFCSHGDAHV